MNLLPPVPGRLRLPTELLAVGPAAPIAPVRDVVSQAQSQLPRAVPAGGTIAEAFPGAQLRIVRVLERISDDAYRVAIEGRSLAVKLAGDHEPGRVLALAFPEPLPDGEPQLHISSAARTALALGPAPGESAPGATLEPMVLVVDAPEAATTLAGELAGRIVSSGLFYESHLADWAEGRRAREDLEREPQARYAARLDEASGATVPGEATRLPAPLEPVVREQLAALERHEARFALPLGEGRPAELIVSHERARPGSIAEDGGAWTTRLRLELPSLGEVNVRLRLMGRSVSLDLEAEDERTDALAEAAQALRARLAGHDLSVVRLVISSHG